ncbi:MAG: H-NS histone family protein, partial [Lautropia sp.]
MASLIDLNRKIAKLQKQADAIKNRERKGIIAQIRQAIVDYELT